MSDGPERVAEELRRVREEVRRRARPMGVFSERTSIERILFAVAEPVNGFETPAS